MIFPTQKLERRLVAQGYQKIIGVDEVGMGCLAGPVVVCAVSLTPELLDRVDFPGLRESKLLSPKQRQNFAQQIKKTDLKWQISLCHPAMIDRLNIYQASRLAMRRSIEALRQAQGNQNNQIVLVDGNKLIPKLEMEQQAVVKGDQRVWVIAVASILAKVYRDELMVRYAQKYPGYGFEIHKGYPTAQHRAALARLGPCVLHRRSFRGVV